ncbi:MAG: ORF6N domain-containing protein [Alphaproteobacteria bacterium]|nr:ORF6N domain-containing protein [Alphaproteobacteria bacterium]
MTAKNLPERHGYDVYMIRGQSVVLDADVAAGFGVETKHVNQAVARNPEKFGEGHGFQLTQEEFAALRSQAVTSDAGRGGTRYPPHAYTVKGVARLATILNTDAALRATDLIIDTFLEVQRQIATGSKQVAVSQPSRLRGGDDGLGARMRKKLARAVTTLLDTVIDVKQNMTARQVAMDLGSGAIENLRERFRTRGLENAKLEADAIQAMAEAEKIYAEARRLHAEAEGIELDNIPKRIAAVREIMALYRETEPSQVVQLLTDIEGSQPTVIGGAPLLPAPATKQKRRSPRQNRRSTEDFRSSFDVVGCFDRSMIDPVRRSII